MKEERGCANKNIGYIPNSKVLESELRRLSMHAFKTAPQ